MEEGEEVVVVRGRGWVVVVGEVAVVVMGKEWGGGQLPAVMCSMQRACTHAILVEA